MSNPAWIGEKKEKKPEKKNDSNIGNGNKVKSSVDVIETKTNLKTQICL